MERRRLDLGVENLGLSDAPWDLGAESTVRGLEFRGQIWSKGLWDV